MNCISEEQQDRLTQRKTLSEMSDWNLGISLTGSLAIKPCFVHLSVPEIGTIKEPSKSQFSMATQSKWTENLVQSGVSNPYDTITIKSLSVCYSILKSSCLEILTHQADTQRLHALSFSATAFIHLNQIACLTKEFEDELEEAKEHWPLQPQKSWDKLCSIWTKYGFLWPEKLYLEFKQQEQRHSIDNTGHHKLWRAKLRPLYEFFPESHQATRDFMLEAIHHFTPLVMYACPFRLCNIKTNTYLGKTDTMSIKMLDPDHTEPSQLLWTFQTITPLASFAFADTKTWVLSGNDPSILLAKNLNRACLTDSRGFQLNPATGNLKTFSSQGWTLSILQNHPKKDAHVNFDFIIHQLKALTDGDIITLSQDALYLRTDILETHTVTIESVESLKSVASINHRFDFSYLDPSASNNSTQPTAASSQSGSPASYNSPTHSAVYLERPSVEIHDGKEYQWRIELVPHTIQDLSSNASVLSRSFTDSLEIIEPVHSESFKSFSAISQEEPVSQWLDGNPKLYQIYQVNSIQDESSIQDDQYDTPEGSYQSISSLMDKLDLSERKREKLPLHHTLDALDLRLSSHSPNQQDDTTSTTSAHHPASSLLSEAEAFKREVQETFKDDKVYETIYHNLFHFSTPSTFASSHVPIRYYDHEDNILRHQNPVLNSRSSHLRSMNITPHSKQSQTTSSSAIANLTPEEYKARRQLRENSLMLLVPQETKQQIWVNAMKQSTLGHWFKSKQKSHVPKR